ncbi:MAG: asparaginase, partial [Gemmatimonadetes bacterium]
MTASPPLSVFVTRGGRTESCHAVHAVVTDAEGRLVEAWGDPHTPTFFRSAAKPFQALPLVEDGVAAALELGPEHLALACGSHSGEPGHVAVARDLLRRAGADEEALECGPHPPFHEPSAKALCASGLEPRPVHNNCSGKHAGMIALARHHGWPVAGYRLAEHRVQARMRDEVARWTGLAPHALGE